MLRCLVTGGAGYIGSHVCKTLADFGHGVTVFDNLSTGFRGFVKWGDLIEGDVTDKDALARAYAKSRADVVIHLASRSLVGESVRNPWLYYWENLKGSLSVANLGLCCPGVVFASSAAAPIDANPYGRSKLMSEKILNDSFEASGGGCISLRFFNVVGCAIDDEIGEIHDPETHLLPNIARAAVNGEKLRFNGDPWAVTRDYVNVMDVAEAVALAAYHAAYGECGVYDIGTGVGTASMQLLDEFVYATGLYPDYEIDRPRAGDASSLVADPKSARPIGWAARRTLAESCRTAALWELARRCAAGAVGRALAGP